MKEGSEKELDLRALEDFERDNEDLARLEEVADRFNIFRALGLIEKELAHSDFLSWLMKPTGNHGFGSQFLKKLLERVEAEEARKANLVETESQEETTGTPPDISGFTWDDWEIRREKRHIDILASSRRNEYVCAIENKVYSSEHDNQLHKYASTVRKRYPDYSHRFVYLTVRGAAPSCDDYLRLTYSDIVVMLEELLANNREMSGSEPYILVSHYIEMVRRYLVKDAEVQALCRKVYNEHKRAIDLILRYGQVMLEDIHDVLIELVTSCQDPGLFLDYIGDDINCICFLPTDLDFIPQSDFGDADTRMLFFEFDINKYGVSLTLNISAGEGKEREKLYGIARKNKDLFPGASSKLNPDNEWFALYTSKKWLTSNQLKSGNLSHMRRVLEKRFEEFRTQSLKQMTEFIKDNY